MVGLPGLTVLDIADCASYAHPSFTASSCLGQLLPPESASAFTSTDANHRPSYTTGQAEKIHLRGVDCPKKHQDFGTKAKHITSILVFAKVVEVDPVTTDYYGRTVAFVRVGDSLVNEEPIRQGLAWVFTRYCDRAIC